jgi:hypothetical protein
LYKEREAVERRWRRAEERRKEGKKIKNKKYNTGGGSVLRNSVYSKATDVGVERNSPIHTTQNR